ncbi:hypothetical protein Mame01_59980 [Microbispora amethystogenes]|nr:hypothetical protein Mame01_59980 [Microbispora amethystogenes]
MNPIAHIPAMAAIMVPGGRDAQSGTSALRQYESPGPDHLALITWPGSSGADHPVPGG